MTDRETEPTTGSSRASRFLSGNLLIVVQLTLLALIAWGPRRIGAGLSAPWGRVAIAVGVLVGVVGLILLLASTIALGRNLTPSPHPKDNATLVQSGPYRFVRHPIYSGLILVAFAWSLIVGGSLTALYSLALAALLDTKCRYEERWLTAKFPDYRDYQKRVRKLIPFIY
jgi:protein-S-isoprenylcysteine O-methyltransferase Ste14